MSSKLMRLGGPAMMLGGLLWVLMYGAEILLGVWTGEPYGDPSAAALARLRAEGRCQGRRAECDPHSGQRGRGLQPWDRRPPDGFLHHPSRGATEAFPTLIDREREMLHLMAQGASNAEISRLLSLSPKTVANYVSNILHKLQVADRKAAVARAREAGLGRDTEIL